MEHIRGYDKYIQEIIRTIPDVIRGIEIVRRKGFSHRSR